MMQILSIATALLLLGVLLVVTWTLLLGRVAVPTAPAAFIGYQSLNVFGIATVSRYDQDWFSYSWPFLVLASLACFVSGALLASRVHRFEPARETTEWRARPLEDDISRSGPLSVLIVLAIVSLGVGIWFAQSVGYNTLLVGFESLVGTKRVDASLISQLREQATRGEYRGVGYVSQFTAFILPAIIIILYVSGRARSNSGLKIFALMLAVVDAYFLTVVGGRTFLLGALLSFFLMVGRATSPLPQGLRVSRVAASILASVGVVLVGWATLSQGRDEGRSALYAGTVGMYERLGGDYSELQVRAIAILHPTAPVWGEEWVERLSIVLPGRDAGLMFDARLYGLLYGGNTNGNLPLDPWGSYFYNFGIVGMLAIPFILGYVVQVFTIEHLVRGSRRLTQVVCKSMACYMFIFLCDPYSVLLSGPVTLVLLAWVFRFFQTGEQGSRTLNERGSRSTAVGRPLVGRIE